MDLKEKNSMNDKNMKTGTRKYKRYSVEEMEIDAKTVLATETELLDISIAGACITTQENLKFDGHYLIKLERDGITLPLQCNVIWEKLSVGVKKSKKEFIPVYKAGIAFTDLSPDKLIKLKDFMRVSGIPFDKRLGEKFKPTALRFKIQTNEKALLFYPKKSQVKKLSLGGMLVELSDGVQIERKFPMALFLPGDSTPIKFHGRIASRIEIPDNESNCCDFGIEFLDLKEDDKIRLNKFLNHLR